MMIKRKKTWKKQQGRRRFAVFLLALAVFAAGSKAAGLNVQTAFAGDEFVIEGGVLTAYTGNERKVVVPDGVTAIGSRAFAGKTTVESVVLPQGVERIGDNAFDCCFNLKEAVLPTTLKEMGNYAFAMCTALEELHLPEGIRTMGEGAFMDCKALVHMELPAGLKSIPAQLLSGCEALEELLIPAGVQTIAPGAFERCLPGETQVEAGNRYFKIQNNCLMSMDGREVLLLADAKATAVTLPDGVCRIRDYAFYGAPYLEQITGNQGLEEIGNYSFYKCVNLKNVRFPGTVTHIGTGAFGMDTNLTGFVLEASGGSYAYRNHMLIHTGNNSLEAVFGKNITITVPQGIETIEDFAFSACEGIRVTLPDTIAQISENLAFLQNCTRIELSGSNRNFTISGGFLCDAQNRVLAVADQYRDTLVLPQGVTRLTSELAGAGVRKIVLSPDFYSHLDLDKLLKDFPQLEEIDTAQNPRFDFCDGVLLRHINGEQIACYYISSSTVVRLPQGVTGGCAALPSQTRVLVLPDSVQEVRSTSFWGEGLIKVVLGNQARIEKNAFPPRTVLYVIPDSFGQAYAAGEGYVFRLYEEGTDVSWLPGDCNGDGSINSADGVCLMQVLAEMDVDGFDSQAADVSGNGRIGSEDAVLLMQYLSEYDIVLQ